MSTAGDRRRDVPLPEIGGKGLFTQDLERALWAGEIDLAIHSLKDLPTEGPAGAVLLAIPAREDPRDVMVPRRGLSAARGSLQRLPSGSTVGTSSVRRLAQLRTSAPHLRAVDLRGNVETRVRRVEAGDFDAVILAAAGLRRLGLWPEGIAYLDPPEWLPAPGQGALGIQGRADDPRVASIAAAIDDPATRAAVTAERAFLAVLEGGCNAPIGALASPSSSGLALRAAIYPLFGDGRPVTGSMEGPAAEAAALGSRLAGQMLAAGGADMIPPRRTITREEAVRRFGPARGGTLVFTNGCFDHLHDGHRALLARAKALGASLVVALNSDASVRRLKGPRRPAQPFAVRARALASAADVDAIVPFDEDTPLALIEALRPDVLVKGADYDRASVVGGDVVEASGGRVVLVPLLPGVSTTEALDAPERSGQEPP